jgi:hypothetical protein
MKFLRFFTPGAPGEIKKPDLFFYLAVLILCYFCFCHGDITIVGGWSYTYLNGHITDFYEVNQSLFTSNNYLPSTSLLFALWNIPIRLLGLVTQATTDVGYVVFWYKLLTTLFLAGSAWYLYKIGQAIGLSRSNARLLTIVWVASPLLFFSQFIFSQTDIFTLFFVLMGLYYFLRKKNIAFVLLMGVSFTFKYYSLLVFIPLLLLIEKNPFKLIGYSALALAPVGIELFFYRHSAVLFSELSKYGFMERLFGSQLPISSSLNLYLFPLIWLLICGICYFIKNFRSPDAFYQTSFYVCLAVCVAFFSLVLWHPQYILLITPFLAITTFKSQHSPYFLILDFILMVAFTGYVVCQFPLNVDQSMMRLGLLGQFNPALGSPEKVFEMAKFFTLFTNHWQGFKDLYFTVFVVVLMLNLGFKFPRKWNSWVTNDQIVPVKEYWSSLRLAFFGGTAVFVVPAFLAYFLTLLKG